MVDNINKNIGKNEWLVFNNIVIYKKLYVKRFCIW